MRLEPSEVWRLIDRRFIIDVLEELVDVVLRVV